MGHGDGALIGDDDALAGGQTVLLDDVGGPEAVQGGGQLGLGGAHGGLGGGYAGGGHDLLGEGLRALQAGGLSAGTEAGDPRITHGVGDTGHQGRLGTDDDEVRPHLGGQGHDLLGDAGVDVEVRGDGRGPGVAGGDDELGGLRVTGEGTGQGVLARAGAEEQDLHGVSLDDGGRIMPGIAGTGRLGTDPVQPVSRENLPHRPQHQVRSGGVRAGVAPGGDLRRIAAAVPLRRRNTENQKVVSRKRAPYGSATSTMRPNVKSMGSTTTLPPSSRTRWVAASASSTPK